MTRRVLAAAALAAVAVLAPAPAGAHPACPTHTTCALLHAVCDLHSAHCELPHPATATS